MEFRKIFYSLLRLYLLISSIVFAGTKTHYNVTSFGAKGDGKTLNTKAIQNAIDECANNGGGTVVVPAGTYLTGTIVMKDNVTLELQAGSKILGSKNIEDYPLTFKTFGSRAIIVGDEVENVSITGFGTIDGQGKYLQKFRIPGKYDKRPFLIKFTNCKNVTVENISLQYPPAWVQAYEDCNGVTIRNIKVFAHGGVNNDMLDIIGSQNVVITGLRGDSDDDGICLKSPLNVVKNVVISDCIVRSRTNTIKFGTGGYGGFKDIAITNCYVSTSLTNDGYSGRDEGLAGIALEIVDGGLMENITISNIVIDEMAAPIFIRLGNRATHRKDMPVKPIGKIRNICINNIIARNAGKNGCSILGEVGHPIENIFLSNIKINFDGGGTFAESQTEKPELVNEYPECISLGDLPAYGFFIRHVNGITFRDVELSYNKEEHRTAMLFNDVQNVKIFNFDAETSDDALGQIVLQKSQDIFVNGCSPKNTNTFLRIEQSSKKINIVGNNFKNVNNPLVLDETINTDDINIISNLRTGIAGETTLFEFLQPKIERDSLGIVNIYFPYNSEIFYTTDGSIPTKKSIKYSKPFEQITPVEIKAIALKNNKKSSIAMLKLERAKVIIPQVSPVNQFFYKNIKVKLSSSTKGSEIYYTLDRSEPTKSSKKYEDNLVINKSTTLRVKAFKKDYKPSKVITSNYQTIKKGKGVQYKYYETTTKNKWDKLPNFLLLKPNREGITNKFTLEGIKNSGTYFGLVMHGFIDITNSGSYSFYLGSNDGSKLFVDNKELIDNDGNHGYIEKTGKVYLSKGKHLIEIRYYQAGGAKHLKIFWEGPGFGKQEITADKFKY